MRFSRLLLDDSFISEVPARVCSFSLLYNFLAAPSILLSERERTSRWVLSFATRMNSSYISLSRSPTTVIVTSLAINLRVFCSLSIQA